MRTLSLLALMVIAGPLVAHPGGHGHETLDRWTLVDGGETFEASFVAERDGIVLLATHEGDLLRVPITNLSEPDQSRVHTRSETVRRLNAVSVPVTESPIPGSSSPSPVPLAFALGLLILLTAAGHLRSWRSATLPFVGASILALIVGLTTVSQAQPQGTPAVQKAFEPFKDKLKLRTDATWLYVESNGIPDHPMMTGIRAWQQQVPLPQPYTGNNAWQIPLNPKLADKPISAKNAFYRGAIALAVNGVPIFNAYNNRGEDAFLIGELDEYGGHCGRADDYHYHAAPVHLEKIAGKGNPIGYALDGFPLFGYTDASGQEPKDLDDFNGRMEKDGYRYYSTKKYPYINGGMRGVVKVVDDQADPQPRAASVRPALQALRGATITGFDRNDTTKTYEVKYAVNGKPGSVKYVIGADNKYTFTFTEPGGKSTTETYTRREGGGGKKGGKDDKKGPKKDGKDNPPPKKGDNNPPKKGEAPMPKEASDRPRIPWIGAHFDELDTNKDGLLTLDELKAEVEKTFNGYDANKDGQLSPYEQKQGQVRSPLAGFVKGHAAEFSDKDGVISKAGFQDFMFKLYEKSDRKKTGKLTKAEASQGGPGPKN